MPENEESNKQRRAKRVRQGLRRAGKVAGEGAERAASAGVDAAKKTASAAAKPARLGARTLGLATKGATVAAAGTGLARATRRAGEIATGVSEGERLGNISGSEEARLIQGRNAEGVEGIRNRAALRANDRIRRLGNLPVVGSALRTAFGSEDEEPTPEAPQTESRLASNRSQSVVNQAVGLDDPTLATPDNNVVPQEGTGFFQREGGDLVRLGTPRVREEAPAEEGPLTNVRSPRNFGDAFVGAIRLGNEGRARRRQEDQQLEDAETLRTEQREDQARAAQASSEAFDRQIKLAELGLSQARDERSRAEFVQDAQSAVIDGLTDENEFKRDLTKSTVLQNLIRGQDPTGVGANVLLSEIATKATAGNAFFDQAPDIGTAARLFFSGAPPFTLEDLTFKDGEILAQGKKIAELNDFEDPAVIQAFNSLQANARRQTLGRGR